MNQWQKKTSLTFQKLVIKCKIFKNYGYKTGEATHRSLSGNECEDPPDVAHIKRSKTCDRSQLLTTKELVTRGLKELQKVQMFWECLLRKDPSWRDHVPHLAWGTPWDRL